MSTSRTSKSTSFDDLRITHNRIVRRRRRGHRQRFILRPRRVARGRRHAGKHLWTRVYVADNVVDRTGRNNIIARVSKDAVYERNILANSSRYDTGHSIFCFNTDGIKIQYNEAYGNVGEGGIDRGGFDADYNCVNTFIQYNYSHDNLWFCGIMKRPNRNVVIRYNVSQNDREGIYFYGFEEERQAEDIHIYNNTHFVRKGLEVSVFPEGRTPLNSTFENNIFYFEGEGHWGRNAQGINTTFRNNLYFNIEPHPSDARPMDGRSRLRRTRTGRHRHRPGDDGRPSGVPAPRDSPCRNASIPIRTMGDTIFSNSPWRGQARPGCVRNPRVLNRAAREDDLALAELADPNGI